MGYSCIEAQCWGKTPYTGKAEALRRIAHQLKPRRRKTGHHGRMLCPYRCAYCHQWHVGSERMKERG